MSSVWARSSSFKVATATLILLVLGICSTLWDLSPRPSSFPSLAWSSALRPCNNRPCLDLPDGLRILDSHIRHVTGIWDLVEGLGYPGRQTFAPTRKRLPFGSYPLGPLQDDVSHAFMNRMKRFISKGDKMDVALAWEMSSFAIHSFRDIAIAMSSAHKIIGEVEDPRLRRNSSSMNNNRASVTATDRVLNTTLVFLVGTIVAQCDKTVRNVNKVLSEAANASSAGNELVSGWDTERARVKDALGATPWWEVLTLAHWVGHSDTTLYREYSTFLEEEEIPFRLLAEAVSAIHDNLVQVREYCLWYSSQDVGFK
ncbi:hypothetical protein C8R47DRAFT_1217784 [Mycena vitilis]|nr:hypothetical protein C8R47DRAFT_1217784 [Mycena vitilis]